MKKITDKLLKQILNEQKKTADILIELSKHNIVINDRAWRSFVRKFNDEFDKHDRYIASDSNGYYLTTNKKKISKTAYHKFKNAYSMMMNAKKDLSTLSTKDQLALFTDDMNMYDAFVKFGE